VAKNKIFGYRLKLGYNRFIVENSASGAMSEPLHAPNAVQTFGFGLARNETIRFWIGPQLGVYYIFGEHSYSSFEVIPIGFSYTFIPYEGTVKYSYLGLDLMIALGLNINIGNMFTIFFDLAFGYTGRFNLELPEVGHGIGAQISMGFMFRIKDRYSGLVPTDGSKEPYADSEPIMDGGLP
jgi:hypothetical protein